MFACTALCMISALSAPDATVPPKKDILVGINYFAGWWEAPPNKWHGADGADWRPKYPQRVPLLGEFNNQATMDREIKAAAGHGVDFFAILWYYNGKTGEKEPNARNLERGVLDFMHSSESGRMKFYVEFCNHPPYDVATDEDWQDCIQFWLTCFRHPSYLRVDGKLVFKVHGGHYFVMQNGKDLAKCKAKLDQLRTAVRNAGLGEMLIGCGVGGPEPIPAEHWAAKLFDFTATYMDLPQQEQRPEDYPFSDLEKFTEEGRAKHFNDAVPYLPYAAAGWNPRPWPDKRACYAFPNKDEWTAALESVKKDLLAQSQLGLPGGAKAFTIYAWNEFGEGGIVAPTQGDQCMKLDGIEKVFGGM